MSVDEAASGPEAQWEWNTRVTAEAARIALAQGKTPQERFEIYEKLIAAAFAARQGSENSEDNKSAAANAACPPARMFYDDVESGDLSGFEE